MLLTPHTFIGLVVARFTGNPLLVAPVAFLSHFIFDKFPHWDFFSNTTNDSGQRTSGWRLFALVADFGLALSLGWFFILRALWADQNSSMALAYLVGAIFANLPDALEAPYIFHMKIYQKSKMLQRLTNFQKTHQTQAPWLIGVFLQLVIIGFCLFLLLG
ncbi:hypothetical protein L6255_03255 [Candidatus Parcubacteria bacterium]|nr:hypothetical protein [Patescibacteria group bacterium]MBU4381177.1 hypothetical protein [Patescibacteria group bacterium]MCG2689430.1 hypothetical protein [Candidatus Parcubacteria bacterium]